MADVMLPLFDNMPRVLLAVKDDAAFHKDPSPLAVYLSPNILINPNHPPTSSFNNLKDTICHELIHAWLHWKGLDRVGEFLDDCHNEWFVRKALEINKMNIDGLKVDVEFLLTTPKAIDIYNRVGGIWTAPHLRDETPKVKEEFDAIRRQLVEIFRLSKTDYFVKVAIICFLVVIASLFLNVAHLIPNAVAGFVWGTWAMAVLTWMSIEAWKELCSRRLSRINIFEKRAMSWPDGLFTLSLGLGMVALVYFVIWLFRTTLLIASSMDRVSSILVSAGLFFVLLAVFYISKFSWSEKWYKIMAALTIGSLVFYALVVMLK